MKCSHCLKEIDDESMFCEFCGGGQTGQGVGDESDLVNENAETAENAERAERAENDERGLSGVAAAPTPVKNKKTGTIIKNKMADDPVGLQNTEDLNDSSVFRGADGVYRWVYQMNMWTNPTLIMTVLKVLLIAALVPTLLVSGLALVESGMSEALTAFIDVGSVVGVIMLALFAIAYPLVAVMNGGRYCVAFELDEKGVKHIQMQKQFKRSQVLSMITALVGAVAGNPTVTGAGLLANSKKSSYSQFSKVKSVVARPNRHVIYVNESFERNQVYVSPENFELILEFIGAKCKKAKVSRR